MGFSLFSLLPCSKLCLNFFFFWDHSSGGVQICCCGVTAEREIRSNDYVPNHGVHLRQSVSYVCGAVCHALSLSRSLSLCHLQPTPLYCTHHYAYTYLRCFYGAAPPVAANACWIRVTTTTNPTNPNKGILFCEQKKLNPLSPFLPEPSCSSSSICTCKLIISLSVYLCVCLPQLSP